MKKGITLVLLLLVVCSYSQIGGKYVYQFLNLAPSPRQAALGGKIVTINDFDVNMGFYNPAVINKEMHKRLSANYGSYYGEVSYGAASYAYNFNKKLKTLHAGIRYINYGNFEGRDELGNLTSDFTGSEAALSMGYSGNIPNSNLFIGANVKMISSTLETYNSWGIASDIGLLYLAKDKRTNFGIAFRNIGFQITPYQDVKEDLPFAIDAGISQLLENVPIRWHLTLENLQQWDIAFSNPNRSETTLDGSVKEEKVSFFNNVLRHTIIGAEIFPEKGFNIRLGYNFRRGQELKILDQRSFAGISAGFGLRFGRMKFDYSYSRYTLAASTNLFGLSVDFN